MVLMLFDYQVKVIVKMKIFEDKKFGSCKYNQ